jgi:hypothetical protein
MIETPENHSLSENQTNQSADQKNEALSESQANQRSQKENHTLSQCQLHHSSGQITATKSSVDTYGLLKAYLFN